MSDQSPNDETKGIAFQVIDTWKLRQRGVSYLPMLPPEFYPLIGKVIAIWGLFDTVFDQFLKAMKRANGTEAKAGGSQFKKRRERFREEMQTALAGMPSVIAYCEQTMVLTETLFPKRNLIAHGHLLTEIIPAKESPTGKPFAKLIAIGR